VPGVPAGLAMPPPRERVALATCGTHTSHAEPRETVDFGPVPATSLGYSYSIVAGGLCVTS